MTSDIAGNPVTTAAWQQLEVAAEAVKQIPLSKLLDEPNRYSECSLLLDGLLYDFSRQRVDAQVLDLLIQLAEQRGLPTHIEALCSGATVNQSESRAALHTALRANGSAGIRLEGADVDELVRHELGRFLAFADAVREGQHTGHNGARIRRVINIGIGGSDLGPRMVTRALAQQERDLVVGYAAGLDGIELHDLLTDAVPEETLFIVCSKTFTTLETRTNADVARDWLLRHLPEEAVATNFAAVSVNDPALDEFGIAQELRFRMWDWVGGRYSVWSAIGLAAAMSVGQEAFREFLAGAAAMDTHFRSAPLRENIPVIAGLTGIWNRNFLHLEQAVILPYDQRLELLPDYLQQLYMESLGKSVRQDGAGVDYATGESLWGGPGSNAQHSFAQWLHQGAARAAVDYIGTARGPADVAGEGHLQALANMIAQAEALARGRSEADVLAEAGDLPAGLAAQKAHPGSRPSSVILLDELTPRTLGMLLALYEHQVFVRAAIWGINPFDQWGVELGKVRAKEFARYLQEADVDKLPGVGRRILDWSGKSS